MSSPPIACSMSSSSAATNSSAIVVNDVLDELYEENRRLADELAYERRLTAVLDTIRRDSLVLVNDCKCNRQLQRKSVGSGSGGRSSTADERVHRLIDNNKLYQRLIDDKQSVSQISGQQQQQQPSRHELAFNGKHYVIEDSAAISTTTSKRRSSMQSLQEKHHLPPDVTISEISIVGGNGISGGQQRTSGGKQLSSSVDDLNHHSNTVHRTIQSQFHCRECRLIFPTREQLTTHLIQEHTYSGGGGGSSSSGTGNRVSLPQIPQFSCQMCPKVFQKGSALLNHMSVRHNVAAYRCPTCDWKGRSTQSLNYHYNARHCPKAAANSPMKSSAMRKIGRRVRCQHCDWTGKSLAAKSRHITTTHRKALDDNESGGNNNKSSKFTFMSQSLRNWLETTPPKTKVQSKPQQPLLPPPPPQPSKTTITGKYRKTIYKCPLCEWTGKSAASYCYHKKVHKKWEAMKKSTTAPDSQQKFTFVSDILKGKSTVKSKLPVIRSIILPTVTALDDRQSTGAAGDNVYYRCYDCQKDFDSVDDLKRHASTVHQNIHPYCCDKCSAIFSSWSQLSTHSEHMHNRQLDQPSFSSAADPLEYVSTTYSAANEPAVTVVAQPTNKTTTIIGKNTFMKTNDKQNNSRKQKPKTDSFKCQICVFGGKNIVELIRHLAAEHAVNGYNSTLYQCSECTASFSKDISIRYHLTSIHKIPAFECLQCFWVGMSKQSLNYHEKSKHQINSSIGSSGGDVSGNGEESGGEQLNDKYVGGINDRMMQQIMATAISGHARDNRSKKQSMQSSSSDDQLAAAVTGGGQQHDDLRDDVITSGDMDDMILDFDIDIVKQEVSDELIQSIAAEYQPLLPVTHDIIKTESEFF
ncbi:zinc finger protein 345-like isoform X2 [Oppia nitens]|uniref:zinc finger protein 345-like isoform X2 n=1 Tax=Oppia nitens TaxID=1686743 RepID=UPI0023DACA04|nr:zinc finger protein 345-like isoform X2 [Oppia nitens]